MTTTSNEQQQQQQDPPLDAALVKKLVLKEFNGPKMITKDASLAAGELLRLFVLEARNRASIEAECDTTTTTNGGKGALIRPDHITKIAAELLMDFS